MVGVLRVRPVFVTNRRSNRRRERMLSGCRRRFGGNCLGVLSYSAAVRVNISLGNVSRIMVGSMPPGPTGCLRETKQTKQHVRAGTLTLAFYTPGPVNVST